MVSCVGGVVGCTKLKTQVMSHLIAGGSVGVGDGESIGGIEKCGWSYSKQVPSLRRYRSYVC